MIKNQVEINSKQLELAEINRAKSQWAKDYTDHFCTVLDTIAKDIATFKSKTKELSKKIKEFERDVESNAQYKQYKSDGSKVSVIDQAQQLMD